VTESGRTATDYRPADRGSNLGLFCHLERIVDFDAEVSHRTFAPISRAELCPVAHDTKARPLSRIDAGGRNTLPPVRVSEIEPVRVDGLLSVTMIGVGRLTAFAHAISAAFQHDYLEREAR
jgi:hypothetical protein